MQLANSKQLRVEASVFGLHLNSYRNDLRTLVHFSPSPYKPIVWKIEFDSFGGIVLVPVMLVLAVRALLSDPTACTTNNNYVQSNFVQSLINLFWNLSTLSWIMKLFSLSLSFEACAHGRCKMCSCCSTTVGGYYEKRIANSWRLLQL